MPAALPADRGLVEFNSASPAGASTAPPAPRRLLGDVITDLGFASRESVEAAVAASQAEGRLMGELLVERGVVSADQLARAVAQRFSLDYLDLAKQTIDPKAMSLLSGESARRLRAVPVALRADGTLLVAVSEPSNVIAVDDVAMITGRATHPVVVAAEDLELLLSRIGGADFGAAVSEVVDDAPAEPEPRELISLDDGEDGPAVKLVRSIVAQAIERGASDVHFDPETDGMEVRMRVDGVLSDSTPIPKHLVASVVSRIKILADLDIAERRLPQDGRISLSVDGRPVDLRVVVLPLIEGESVVLRVLDRNRERLSLEALGLQGQDLERVNAVLQRTHGAVLATGPTGSGKTTTLYAALSSISSRERTILTIEDPVEYRVPGIRQVQVSTKTGLTFAAGLRAMVRADPDVIMVGEIRDSDSAKIAVQAAVTGHLVLSTLHTNDAATAITRLIDMGVEPFLVASAMDCVIAQRLVRELCADCKAPSAIEMPPGPDGEPPTVFEPVGCPRCFGTGYRGRLGVFEVMAVTDEIRSAALRLGSSEEIARIAVEQGMTRLRDDGLAKVRSGQTSLAEVARVAGASE
ncbi:MAG: GspE/PulE family protein [Solirubrobacteraceae bacterium]